MSITGLPGQGPVRVGIPIADLCAGLFCAHGHPDRAARAREVGRGPVGRRPRCCRRRSSCSTSRRRAGCRSSEVAKQAGNDHPTSIPTGVFKTADGHINIATTGAVIWERFCKAMGAEALMENPDYTNGKLALEEPQEAQRRDRQLHREEVPAPSGSTCSTRPACRAARSTPSTRCSPTRRSSISASRRARRRRTGSPLKLVGQPLTLSRTHEQDRRAAAGARRAHRRGAEGIRLQARRTSPRCARPRRSEIARHDIQERQR